MSDGYRELKNKSVICRKPHLCEWCGETINVKEEAQYRTYIYEGFMSAYTHIECYNAMMDMVRLDYEVEFEFGIYNRGTCEPKW